MAFFALAAPAAAVPDCAGVRPAKTLLSGQGVLESIIGGPDDSLYYTDTDKQALMRLDAPGATPTVVADGIQAPGGLLVNLEGPSASIIVGYGDGAAQGALGNLVGMAGLVRVDLATGRKTTLISGTSMSNGLARDPAGIIYASTDVGTGIDRIVGDRVQRNWSTVISGNGLAISGDGRFLFVNQTFQPAAIKRVALADPSQVETYAAPTGAQDLAAGLDGLTIDGDDRLFAAANQAGEVWRINTDRSICAVARGLHMTSAVAFGPGGAFPATSLYAVGFDGTLVEIPAARTLPGPAAPARRPHLRVRVRPRFVRAGRRTTVTLIVYRGRTLEPRAAVRLGHTRVVRTDRRGRARVTVRPRRRGFLRLRVRAAGVLAFKEKVRVLRARPAPRPVALTD